MEVVFFFLPIVLLTVVVVVAGLLWLLRSGQLDDLDTPAVRMLFDEDSEIQHEKNDAQTQSVKGDSKK